MTDKNKILRPDAKGRISLGDLIPPGAVSFRAIVSDNGEIILTPMMEMPLREKQLWDNKAALASVKKGLAESARGETVPLDMNRLEE